MTIVISIAIPVALIVLGLVVGSIRERRHLAELDRREQEAAAVMVVDVKSLPPGVQAAGGVLVMGEVVIAADYFKTFAAWLRNLIGGEVRTYQTMLNRARREARLRMVEQAQALGADLILNVRFEWSAVGPSLPSTEIFCSGTAVIPKSA